VDLVAEQDRAAVLALATLLRLADDLADPRHPLGHRAEHLERLVRVLREQPRERRLAAAWRSPEDHAADAAALDREPERLARAEQVVLADELVQRPRPHPLGERGLVRAGEERQSVRHHPALRSLRMSAF